MDSLAPFHGAQPAARLPAMSDAPDTTGDRAVAPSPRARGGCLCGAVRYRVTGPLRDVLNCHCERCRRITGHHMAASAARAEDIDVDDSSTLRWFHPDDDLDIGYAFCATCGSSLFWRPNDDAEQWSICAGTLDGPTGLTTIADWFADEAGDYFELDPGTEHIGVEPGR